MTLDTDIIRHLKISVSNNFPVCWRMQPRYKYFPPRGSPFHFILKTSSFPNALSLQKQKKSNSKISILSYHILICLKDAPSNDYKDEGESGNGALKLYNGCTQPPDIGQSPNLN